MEAALALPHKADPAGDRVNEAALGRGPPKTRDTEVEMRLTSSRHLVLSTAVLLAAAGRASSSDDRAAATTDGVNLEAAAQAAVAATPPPAAPKPVPVTPEPRKLWGGEDGEVRLLNRLQFRWSDTFPDDSVQLSGTGAPGDSKGQFRIRRAKTELTGWVWKQELTYELQLSWAGPEPGASTQTPLEDFILSYDVSKNGQFKVTVGQFKVPLGRQEMTSSGKQLFCDRDLLSFEFTRGRDIGIQLEGALAKGKFEYMAGIFNGNPASRLGNDNDKYQYNLRLSFQPFGDVKYSEGDFESKDKPLLAISGQFEHNDQRRPGTAGLDPIVSLKTVVWGGDVVLKVGGLYLFGEYFGREREPISGPSFRSDGWHAQASYFLVRDKLETGIRYARWDPTDLRAGDDQIEQGAAVNYYFRKHGLKLQGDYRQIENKLDATKTRELRIQTQVMF
jgi:phosphate-selective porin OprO and OprP